MYYFQSEKKEGIETITLIQQKQISMIRIKDEGQVFSVRRDQENDFRFLESEQAGSVFPYLFRPRRHS